MPVTPAPLAGLRFSVAGPGKVGRSLAAWMQAGGAQLVSLAGRVELAEISTAGQDLLLVAVPDGVLAAAATVLGARPQARIALHTAGAASAAALAPLAAGGTAVGSLHPLKAFPAPLLDPDEARGICFAIDGDPAAMALARRLAAAWAAVAVEVPAAARPLYHLAASLAAGGVVTLLAAAAEIAAALGLSPAVTAGYFALARGAMEQAQAAEAARPGGAARALTGPVLRGDQEVVGRALAALRELAPAKLPLVLALSRETLHQRGRLSALTPAQRELLARLAEAPGPPLVR